MTPLSGGLYLALKYLPHRFVHVTVPGTSPDGIALLVGRTKNNFGDNFPNFAFVVGGKHAVRPSYAIRSRHHRFRLCPLDSLDDPLNSVWRLDCHLGRRTRFGQLCDRRGATPSTERNEQCNEPDIRHILRLLEQHYCEQVARSGVHRGQRIIGSRRIIRTVFFRNFLLSKISLVEQAHL